MGRSRYKEVEALLRAAEAAGATVVRGRRGGHYKVLCPNGETVILASTPDDSRGIDNAKAQLRRIGGIRL